MFGVVDFGNPEMTQLDSFSYAFSSNAREMVGPGN